MGVTDETLAKLEQNPFGVIGHSVQAKPIKVKAEPEGEQEPEVVRKQISVWMPADVLHRMKVYLVGAEETQSDLITRLVQAHLDDPIV